jgi:predicted nucleic acid-binding Zn ribbon protein
VKPDRIGDQVRRELARFGPVAGMTEIVRAWPAVVGEQIARNAWPARLARDGKLHVSTSSSAWAFELAQLEPKLLERLAEVLGDVTPAGLRFAPGKLPEPPFEGGQTSRKAIQRPSREDLEKGAALAAEIEDESLRKLVAKAAAESLASGR